MRLLAGIIALAVLPRTAAAEVYPVKQLTGGLAFVGYSGSLNGVTETGIGPQADVAVRMGRRTQLVVEAGLSRMHVGDVEPVQPGVLVRGAAGARWIALSFDFEGEGAVEMTLDALAGANKIWWDDGGTLVRPELGFGVAIQARKYRSPHVSFGFRIRVYFSPADDTPMTAARCTGSCGTSPMQNGGTMFAIWGAL